MKLQAKDLRITNLVNDPKFHNEAFEIVSLDKYGTSNVGLSDKDGYFINGDITELQPIPLTEEWLLKFGFKGQEILGTIVTEYSLDNHRIQTGANVFIFIGYKDGVEINHVHQLQNLFFALTGEELTIK